MEAIGKLCSSRTREELNFEWKIGSFSKRSTYFESPIFYFAGAQDCVLIIHLYKSTEYVGLFLHSTMLKLQSATINMSMGLKTADGMTAELKSKNLSTRFSRNGWTSFISQSQLMDRKAELLPSDTLTVICTLEKGPRNDEREFDKAIEMYSKAIEENPHVAAYYGNRSFAYLKTECFGYALNDASKAIELDESYVKGYYRRAAAYMSLGKFKQALKDFSAVTTARPNDKDAKAKYVECSKIVKRKAFENAISVEETKKSVADSLNLETMTIEDCYSGPCLENGKVTLEFMKQLMETYKEGKKLHRRFAYQMLLDVKVYFEMQPTMVEVTIPDDSKFTVCGDIHGQYYDLLNIFEMNGLPSESNPYLFNGDFVDRGSFSVECIFTLFGFKLLYPNHFFMSRGNHESQTMNQMYGFEGEVKAKYSPQMSDLFTEVYNWLPLCHLLNKRVLVMHGGLFSDPNVTLDDIRKIDRNRQPPEKGLMCELLWSDPQPQCGTSPSKRGVGIEFGPDVTKAFLSRNKLEYVIRSHEVKAEGYEVTHDGKCITVFSAPNYCDTMGNKGAFITMNGKDMKPKFVTYSAVPHPNVKPMAYASSLLAFM